jgi:hypothetical protein
MMTALDNWTEHQLKVAMLYKSLTETHMMPGDPFSAVERVLMEIAGDSEGKFYWEEAV